MYEKFGKANSDCFKLVKPIRFFEYLDESGIQDCLTGFNFKLMPRYTLPNMHTKLFSDLTHRMLKTKTFLKVISKPSFVSQGNSDKHSIFHPLLNAECGLAFGLWGTWHKHCKRLKKELQIQIFGNSQHVVYVVPSSVFHSTCCWIYCKRLFV